MNESGKEWNLPPTLGRFLGCDHPARLAVGPFGSGKSTACILEFLRRAQEQRQYNGLRRTRFAAIRNTYPELRDTTRKTFEQVIPSWLGMWKEQEFKFHMRFEDVDCEILFRSLDRPEDVKKLLSLELTGAYINEWREIPQEIFEGLTGRIDRYPSLADGGQTWSGIWGDSNPWHPTHWIPTLLRKYPDTIKIFRQPGGRSPHAENIEHLKPGYYDRMCVGKDQDWISVYVDGQDAVATEGSIYGRHLAALRAEGRLLAFEHDPSDVFTAWDFGIADSMAIWCFRFNEWRGVDWIDWYENSGYGLSHYFEWLASRPWTYKMHVLPHDGKNRSWHSGRSARELFMDHFGSGAIRVLPALDVEDGIGAVRWLLEQQTTRIHARCDEVPQDADLSGIATLAEYKHAWDEKNKCFSKLPLHNFASHTADAARTLAQIVRYGELVTRPPERVRPVVIPPLDRAFNLDQLFADNEKDKGRRRI